MKKSILILLLLVIGPLGLTVQAQGTSTGSVVIERVYVTGNVAKPQELLFSPTLTLTRALACVGGELRDTDKENVIVYRIADGRQLLDKIRVNLKGIRKGKGEDFVLKPYDIVCVPNKKERFGSCPSTVLLLNPTTLRPLK